jgi:hypothetical protein
LNEQERDDLIARISARVDAYDDEHDTYGPWAEWIDWIDRP